MFTILLTLVHVVVCFFLVIVVLLQSGKAADLAGAFGGMGSQTTFGPRGSASVLSSATTLAAALFMVTSLSLAIISTRIGASTSTVLESEGSQAAPVEQTEPSSQPSVTLGTEGGTGETVPFDLPPPDSEAQPEQQPAPEN